MFAPLRWPGKTADRYQQYLDEQAAGLRDVLVVCADGAFAAPSRHWLRPAR